MPAMLWHLSVSARCCTQADISYWIMTTSSGEETVSAPLSIARSDTNLKGHELTPNVLAPAGLGSYLQTMQATRKLNTELHRWSMPFHCAPTRHRNHMWASSCLPPIHISLFRYLQQMKHSDGKTAAIDWLVATLFWVTFHKWSRLVK